jgi:hypothetical protein
MRSKKESEVGHRSGEENTALAVHLMRACGGWLSKLRGREIARPRLALLERISLAPKQSLALVEAEGRRFLVATSSDGSPAFYALDETRYGRAPAGARSVVRAPVRVSW